MDTKLLDHKNYLCWIDCEMTQLSVEGNLLLEIAVLVTDRVSYENVLPGINLIVHRDSQELEGMLPLAKSIYEGNGLLKAVAQSPGGIEDVDVFLDQWMGNFNFDGSLITVGNSPVLDRFLIETQLPRFHSHLSHTMIDVTSIKNFFEPYIDLSGRPVKKRCHRAWEDLRECREEAMFYRDLFPNFLRDETII